jgi:hypothetical protein
LVGTIGEWKLAADFSGEEPARNRRGTGEEPARNRRATSGEELASDMARN